MIIKYDLKLAILIFILTVSVYLIFMDGNMTSDGYFYFLCAQSIVRDHDLSIEPELPYGNQVDCRAVQRIDGKKYLYNHFGWAVLLLPLTALGTFLTNLFPYKVVSMFIASTTNCLVTAFSCVLIYLFSRRLKYSPPISTMISLLYGFTTMAFFYATTSFCEPANSLMVLLSIFFLYCYVQDKSYLKLLFSGLALGYGCFIRIWDLFLLPGILLYLLLYHLKEEKKFKPFKFLQTSAIFLLPILVMVLVHESYFYLTLYSSFLFGQSSKGPDGLTAFNRFRPFSILPTGLYGLLFSTGKGFFFYNPVTLFSLLAFRNFYLRFRLEALLFAYIFITHLIFTGSITVWSGDVAWGPRYLLPTIPFLILLLVEQGRKKHFLPKLLIIGVLAGLIVQLPSILMDIDLYTVQALGNGIRSEELYFIPRLSPIIGTWKMLGSTALSPWFFRLFDQKIFIQSGESITITLKLTILVWSVVISLILIAVGTAYTILRLLRYK